jgi:hypothetical protein
VGARNYERVNLTPEELEKLMKELLEHNHKELLRVNEFAEKNKLSHEAVKILCDKQMITSFTAWTNALEDRVHEIKSRQRRTLTWQEKEKIKADIAKGLEPKNIDQVLDE